MPVLEKADVPEDHAFMDAFFEKHIGFMHFIASKYTSTPEDREDVVQEALIRLVRNLPALRDISQDKVRRYLTLTVRAAYLDIRKHKRHLPIPLDAMAEEALLEKALLDEQSFHKIAAKLDVQRLEKELPRRDWLLLEGKYLKDLHDEELAELIGVTPDSVRMLLSRARKKAAKLLVEPGRKGGRNNARKHAEK